MTEVSAASVPKEPAISFGQVVARDVLHHAPAGLEGFAASRHAGEAENVIARRTRLDAAGPGEIAGQHAAQRAGMLAAEEPRQVGRLEGEILAAWRR